MRGILFTDIHTGNDWNIVLTSKEISRAEPKENYVEVDGADGTLDYTEAFGDVRYKNRPLSFSFSLSDGRYLDREELIAEIVQKLHGRRHQIIIDDDPMHYWDGRCKVENISNGVAYGTLRVKVTADPWYYAVNQTTITLPLQTYNDHRIYLHNFGRKICIPSVTVSGPTKIKHSSGTYNLKAGFYTLPGVMLYPGTTELVITTDSAVRFEYREAIL